MVVRCRSNESATAKIRIIRDNQQQHKHAQHKHLRNATATGIEATPGQHRAQVLV